MKSNLCLRKKNLLSRASLLIGFVLSITASFAQQADTSFVYTNLDSAILHPLDVYKLDLSKQGIREFPKSISTFSNLRFLDLQKNRLKSIPKEVASLVNLEHLDASKNNLEEVSPEIRHLVKLKNLILSRNNLTFIPASLGELVNLEYLDLWDNNLSPLPEEIKNLKKLIVLDLRGILFNEEEHVRLFQLLPECKIFLSPSCNCRN